MDNLFKTKALFSIALLTTFLSVFLIYRSLNQTTEIRNTNVEVEVLQETMEEKDVEIADLRQKVISISTENTNTDNESNEEDEQQEEQVEVIEVANGTNTEARALIKSFIEKEYNYDTDSYISRLEDIKTYMSEEAYESLHGQYKLEELEVEIESNLKSLQIFESIEDENTFIALAESSYDTDGNTIELGQDVLILKIESVDGNSLITSANIPTSLE